MRPMLFLLALFALVSALVAERPPHARPKPETFHATVDPKLPAYKPVAQLSGSLKAVQSDTTPGLVTLWLAGFKKHYPSVDITAPIEGSGAAGPALTEATADFGLIAREMMTKEETPFDQKFGYRPFEIAIAGGSYRTVAFTDALTFFVNKSNPIEKLSFDQIDAIFSKTRNRGGKEITTWGELGLTGDWADKPIHLIGVQEENGFEHFLRIRILNNGQWKDGITTRETVFPLAGLVAADPYAIGYAGFGYLSDGVKTIALAEKSGGPYYKGTFDEIASQKYPLSRVIYIYANRPPGKPLNPVLKEFIRYILSREGQQAVVDDGIFLPLPHDYAARELKKLE